MAIVPATHRVPMAVVQSIPLDICRTPIGKKMVLVPYTITCTFEVAVGTTGTVNFGGEQAFTMDSRLPRVTGDEPGTGGGIISGVNRGFCRPIEHSKTVRAQGGFVVRH